jgi:hypothetical protein
MLDSTFKMIHNFIQTIASSFILMGTLLASETKVDLFAKAHYWYTSETTDWAFTLADHPNAVQTVYQTLVFDWAPGFSVGIGYTMEHDEWDTQATYTWFQSKASDHAGNGSITPGFLAARLSSLEPFSTGKANMNIHYNMFDLDLGRKFCISRRLSLRPSIGLKGGWINQTIHSHWTLASLPGFTAAENLKQEFQTAGPKSKIEGKWCFGYLKKQTFSLVTAFEAGYLWGHWSIHDQFTDSLSQLIFLKTTPRNYGSIVFHSFLGLAWDYHLNCTHFAFKLGYEIEDWLNQSQFFTDISGSQNNDLVLQGLNLSFTLDF